MFEESRLVSSAAERCCSCVTYRQDTRQWTNLIPQCIKLAGYNLEHNVIRNQCTLCYNFLCLPSDSCPSHPVINDHFRGRILTYFSAIC